MNGEWDFRADYLDFTTWYLQKKGYISRADNSDFTLTAEGVDYIETQRGSLPVLNKLLSDGKVRVRQSGTRSVEWDDSSGRGTNGGGADYPALFDVGLAGQATEWLGPPKRGGFADARV